MMKMHKLDDVLIGYFNQKIESKEYTIINNLSNNKNFKFKNVLVIPAIIVEDKKIGNTIFQIRHAQNIKDLSFLDDLFSNFEGFENQYYNNIKIDLWIDESPVYIEKDGDNNDLYELNIHYCLTEKKKEMKGKNGYNTRK